MVQRRQRERSLFEVLLPDGHKLWPDWLRRIDTALEDDTVIDTVAQARGRCPPIDRTDPAGAAQTVAAFLEPTDTVTRGPAD
jgi:hypothetical protein